MIGRVIASKSLKTATVLVERLAKHPLYKKTYVQSKKYLADTLIEVKAGDIVDFISCRPVSKNKHWKITKVLGKTFAEIAEAQLKQEAENIIAEVMPEEKIEESSSPSGAHSLQPEKKAEQKEKRSRKKKGTK